jgi:hypothetical protein
MLLQYLDGIGGPIAKVVAGVGLIDHVDGIYWYVGAIFGQLTIWFVIIQFVTQCATIVITNGGCPC